MFKKGDKVRVKEEVAGKYPLKGFNSAEEYVVRDPKYKKHSLSEENGRTHSVELIKPSGYSGYALEEWLIKVIDIKKESEEI